MEEQKKKRSPAGIILLIILLLLAGGAGYLYYSVAKAPLELDDPKAMASAAPMSPEERFTFSAADRTADIKVDARDFWNLILDHAGEDFLDLVNAEISSYGLTVSGCAIHMDEEGLGLDLELLYKEKRLVAKVPCNLEFSGNRLSLNPADVKLGAISLPVKGLLSNLELEYELSLPVISEVTQVSFREDALVLTGPMEDVTKLLPSEAILNQTAIFSEELQSLAVSLRSREENKTILSHLEQNPGGVEDLYRDLFILAGAETADAYLDSRMGLTERFLPGIGYAGLAEDQAALSQLLTSQTNLLEQFFAEVSNDFNEKEFQLSQGQFIRKKQPFHPSQYGKGKYDPLFAQLDPDGFFLVLVNVEDGFIRNTPSFYKMCDDKQQFTREVDFNRTYIPGCVFRGVMGDAYLMYNGEIHQNNTYTRVVKIVPLTEADVAELQVPGVFGVWVG